MPSNEQTPLLRGRSFDREEFISTSGAISSPSSSGRETSSKGTPSLLESQHGPGSHIQDTSPTDTASRVIVLLLLLLGGWSSACGTPHVLCLADSNWVGVFISNADITFVVTTYGLIGSEFDRFSSASWVLTSYTLGLCTTQPVVVLSRPIDRSLLKAFLISNCKL